MARRKEIVNYQRVALAIVRRRFPWIWEIYQDDMRQECAMLAFEAESRGNIIVGHGKTRKIFGGAKKGTSKMGIRSFSRAANARLYRAARNYGYRRTRQQGGCSGISSEK